MKMKTKKPFVVTSRKLTKAPTASDHRAVEKTLKELTKTDISTMQIGSLIGCADQKGTQVVVAPRADGAELRVAVHVAPFMVKIRGLVTTLSGLLALGSFAVYGESEQLSMALLTMAMISLSLLFIRRWAASRHANKVADAIAEALPKAQARVQEELADDLEEEEEREAARASRGLSVVR